MILKIRNERVNPVPSAWYIRDDVEQFEVREVIINKDNLRSNYEGVDRDFVPAEGDDYNMNPEGAGYCVLLLNINSGLPGEGWNCLARFGSVYIMSDDGKTIDKF